VHRASFSLSKQHQSLALSNLRRDEFIVAKVR
jgi:hypothetical protein